MAPYLDKETLRDAVVKRRRAIHDARLSKGVNADGLLADAEAVGDINLIVQTHITLGALAVVSADFRRLSEHLHEASWLVDEANSDSWTSPEQSLIGTLFSLQAFWFESLGRLDEAVQWMALSFDFLARVGDRANARSVWFHLCDLEVSNGNLTGSALLHQRMIGWSVVPGEYLASSYYQLARLALADDDLASAQDKVDASAAMTAQLSTWQFCRLQILRGRIALAADNTQEAARALSHPRLDEGATHRHGLALVRARLAIRQGEFLQAEVVLRQLADEVVSQFAVARFGGVAIGLAELALAKGRPLLALDELASVDYERTPYGDRVDAVRLRATALEQAGCQQETVACLAELGQLRAYARRPASLGPGPGADTRHAALDRLLDDTFEHIREVEAAELLRQKRELLGIVAHDLRGALSIVRFVQPRLTNAASTTEERASAVGTMRQATRTMRSIVEALGVLLTIDGGLHGANKPTHISSIVGDVVALATELADRKAQTIVLHDDSTAEALVRSNRDAISLIVSNLVSNAVKYSHRGADIEVSVSEWRDEAETDWIVVAVRDVGQGILESDMPSIWKRYTTASAAPTSGESSFGLGLYIARQLCDSMSGRLFAESEGRGQGARFELRLPKARVSAPQVGAAVDREG